MTVKMLLVFILSMFIMATKTNGPYHHIILQIFFNNKSLVTPIVNLQEGSNLTLRCRTLHLIRHPRYNFYDDDVIWSRAQNWRLQSAHQKSIQNMQNHSKLVVEMATLEDQGWYVCTSLKYHTSRILYIMIETKNRTEQYFRRRRSLSYVKPDKGFDEKSNGTTFSLQILFLKGSFDEYLYGAFVVNAFFVISGILTLMLLVLMCNKCCRYEKSNDTKLNVDITFS